MIRSNRMYRALLGTTLVIATLVVILPTGVIVEAQSPNVTTSVIATRKVIVDDADGTGSYIVTGNYYRDRQGRYRIDEGDFALIADRVLRQTIVLNKRTSKFKRVLWAIVPTGGCDAYACPDSATAYSTSKTALGTQTINGIVCEGTSVTRTIPAFSDLENDQPITFNRTLWVASSDAFLMSSSASDSTGATTTMLKTNLQVGVDPAASLFQIPQGYTEGDVAPTVVQSCRIDRFPAVLEMETFNAADGGNMGLAQAFANGGGGCSIRRVKVPEDGDSFGCLKSLNYFTFGASAYAEWFYQGCYNLSGTPRNFSTATYWKKSTNNRYVNTPTSIIVH